MHAVQLYRCTCFVSIIMSFYLLHISNLFIWFLCPFDPAILQMSSMASIVLAYFTIVWFQKISIPPPLHGRDLPYDPPFPSGFSKIGPQNLPPHLSSRISKIFAHPLEILLSLIEVDKEVVLSTRMPNFVSFMYFLLNCITDKRIPLIWELLMRSSHRQIWCVSCSFCWILQFWKWNARSRSIHNCTFLPLRQEESNTWRGIIKEIRTLSHDKIVWISNFVLPNLHIWVCGRIALCRFHWWENCHAKFNVLEKTHVTSLW